MIVGSVILAGGRSRRMGRPKESLPIGDTTMLGRTVDTLLSCTFPVVVVARDKKQELPPISLEAELVYDERSEQGPLMGILAGMTAARDSCDAVFVIGCDTPFLTADAVDWLTRQLGDEDVVMAKVDDVLQPLGAIYRTSILPTVERLVGEDVHMPRSLAEVCKTRILSEAEVDAFDASRDFLHNINGPEAYDAAIARFGQ
jgi:molybdenum cofactor guanylyltransferase